MRRLDLLLAALLVTACGGAPLDEVTEPGLETREATAAKTCTVAAEAVNVRACWATTGSGQARTISCGLAGSVFATQVIPSTVALAEISLPVDADEKLLGARLESLGLIDIAKDLPADLAAFNDTIRTVKDKLSSGTGSSCKPDAWVLGAVNGLLSTPRGLGFLCSETGSGVKLLDCSGAAVSPVDSATSSPAAQTVNGVSISFAKTGCGSFVYTLRNTGLVTATYASSVSGIPLSPACSGTLRPGSADQTCSVTGIQGGGARALRYEGTVTRGSLTLPFTFNISVRCDGTSPAAPKNPPK